jgi:hypothetical protein
MILTLKVSHWANYGDLDKILFFFFLFTTVTAGQYQP